MKVNENIFWECEVTGHSSKTTDPHIALALAQVTFVMLPADT